jgi:hypothetical protein
MCCPVGLVYLFRRSLRSSSGAVSFSLFSSSVPWKSFDILTQLMGRGVKEGSLFKPMLYVTAVFAEEELSYWRSVEDPHHTFIFHLYPVIGMSPLGLLNPIPNAQVILVPVICEI